MIGAAYGTVEDIEVLWTISSLVGLIFSILVFRAAVGDWKFLKLHNIFNGRRVTAKIAVLGEGTRAIKQMIFLAIGIIALLLPSPPHVDLSSIQSIAGIFVRWGLICASLLTTYQSFLVYSLRKHLERDYGKG